MPLTCGHDAAAIPAELVTLIINNCQLAMSVKVVGCVEAQPFGPMTHLCLNEKMRCVIGQVRHELHSL